MRIVIVRPGKKQEVRNRPKKRLEVVLVVVNEEIQAFTSFFLGKTVSHPGKG